MSRSFRWTPICGNTTQPSDKPFKRQCNRMLRHRDRLALIRDPEAFPPEPNECMTSWDMGKDGKNYRQDWRIDLIVEQALPDRERYTTRMLRK